MYVDIEVSRQAIPLTQETDEVLAESRPLHDLKDDAPAIPRHYDLNRVIFPFSNDESARYFDQVRARTATPEYRQATNRVAIVADESSLTSTLRYIPEETIIVLDNSADMCSFMERYIESLRGATTAKEWGDLMGLTGSLTGNPKKEDLVARLFEQANEWDTSGYQHATFHPNVFTEASQIAREKAIIPWHGDVASRRDMRKLGKALRERNAHVTMVNLSNLLVVEKSFNDAADCAKRLDQLPITPNAPILTTNSHRLPPATPISLGIIMEATGPFFGLDNLRKHGGSTKRPYGNAIERQYVPVQSSGEDVYDARDFMIHLLQGGDFLPLAMTGQAARQGISEVLGGLVISVTRDGLHIVSGSDAMSIIEGYDPHDPGSQRP